MIATQDVQNKPRTVNRSCVRCREKKIKCDRLDPCGHCVAKGWENDCKKELRKKRSKNKRPFPKRKPRQNVGNSGPLGEHDELGDRGSTSDRQSSHASTNLCGKDDSDVDMDGSDSDSDSTGASELNYPHAEVKQPVPAVAMPVGGRCPFAVRDVLTDWKNDPVEKRIAIIDEIKQALPDLDTCHWLLQNIYRTRVHPIHGSIAPIPQVQVTLNHILSEPDFAKRSGYPYGFIACTLMAVVLALRFVPIDKDIPWQKGTVLSAYEHKELEVRQRKLYAIVKRLLDLENRNLFGTISDLQAAILMIVYDHEGRDYIDHIFETAVRSAMRMRLHKLGQFEALYTASPFNAIAGETAIRCWWFLVRRDWMTSQRYYTYRIVPGQFDTRQPLNLSDEDFNKSPLSQGHPLSTWTSVSYSLALNKLAIVTRTFVDEVNSRPPSSSSSIYHAAFSQRLDEEQRAKLDRVLQEMVASLPPHFSLEAEYGQIRRSDIERWLLHQQVFHLFLQLHMPLLSEARSPHGSCIFMSNHVLEIQGKVCRQCWVLDRLSLNAKHAMRASIVLIIDLFYSHHGHLSGLTRMMTRKKVEMALENIDQPKTSIIKLCIQLVRSLLEVEETRFKISNGYSNAGASVDSPPCAVDVSKELEQLEAKFKAICEALDVLMNESYWKAFRKNTKRFHDLIPEWLRKPYAEAGLISAPKEQHSSSNWERVFSTPSSGRQAGACEAEMSMEMSMAIPPKDASPTLVGTRRGEYPGSTPSASSPSSSLMSTLTQSNQSSLVSPSGIPVDGLNVLNADLGLGREMGFDLSFLNGAVPGTMAGTGVKDASLLPVLDVDLVGQEDFEGYMNASREIDFENMLMQWQFDLPQASA